jgi:hypothetical protein
LLNGWLVHTRRLHTFEGLLFAPWREETGERLRFNRRAPVHLRGSDSAPRPDMTFDSAQDFNSGLFVQIGEDIPADLARAGYFALLDDRLCPADPAQQRVACAHRFPGSISILRDLPTDLYDIERILNFFRSQGVRCDCQVLTRYAPESRFQSQCSSIRRH